MKHLIHGLLFSISWGACLFGALNQAVWISFCVSLTCLVLTILLSSPRRRIDFLKTGVVVFLGIGFECVNAIIPLYTFFPDTTFPPAWILCFWIAFSILFIESLKFLYLRNTLISFVFGLIGGAHYWFGETLQLIKFNEDIRVTMISFAFLWAIEFVLILKVCRYIDQKFS